MGMAHILWAYHDGLSPSRGDSQELESAVGKAVVTLCTAPQTEWTEHGAAKVRTEAVLNHGNCLNHAAAVHSTEEQIFIWAGNCLRTLDQLKDRDLEGVKKLFDALYDQRVNRR